MEPVALPPLRDELAIQPGPVGADGSPSWTLHDPLRNQFFRLSWPAFEVLSRWGLEDPTDVARAVSTETTLDLGPEDVLDVAEFLARNQLLRATSPKDTQRLLCISAASKTSWATWLLHHYLFFRVPLVRPDRLLSQLLPKVRWLGGKTFRIATLAALLTGLFLVGRQWDSFATTFVDHVSLTGIAEFGIALGFAKMLHELGHALTAKAFGCRVPTMGAAFLVMMPVLYTDVNEAWKLVDRRKRMLVGGAGILTELGLAAWATLAWGLLPEGAARSMAFTLAATTWISSVAINASPFMRFDGYFLLLDALDMPNLHNRAFALARWWLREVLFQLGEPVPEQFPPRRQAFLIAFAFGVWIYRITLFLGIAVLVYHFFIKVVGIILFAVEMGWFVMRPFIVEFIEWRKRADRIRESPRARMVFGWAAGVVVLTLVPWSGSVEAPAMLKAADHTVLYAPAPALLAAVEVKDGQAVTAGQVLARLDNPDLDYRLSQAERHLAMLRYELASVSFEDSFRGRSLALGQELQAAQAEQSALTAERARHTLTAPFAGVVTDVAAQLVPGQWIGAKEPLMTVRKAASGLVDAYVSEDDLPRLHEGDSARFLAEGRLGSLSAVVAAIDHTAVRALSDPALGAPFGGVLPARVTKQALVPDAALYRVRLKITEPADISVSRRGLAFIDGARQSLFARVWRAAAAVVLREWGT